MPIATLTNQIVFELDLQFFHFNYRFTDKVYLTDVSLKSCLSKVTL